VLERERERESRHAFSRHFWNKKRKYLKDKINELAMSTRTKNIRHLYKGKNVL
jgi:hypothetical protein